MMRSLWAGVTGLQAHQIAMDVEGNNIANVNTTGFKYSRANFSDLLNQTAKIATAPQGELGGKNSMQIGLGTQVSSVTKMFKQGSIETTDKNTDLAISGDGFFVISPDGGNTYKYTRNGDFTFDANGNFVDANGYIAQGWLRDEATGEIDSTAPIRNITIPPGLTTPANDTGYITLKANLNSGDSTKNKSTIYALDSFNSWYDKNSDGIRQSNEITRENDASINQFNTDKNLTDRGLDMGVLFNASGEAFNLRDKQGMWVSYDRAETSFTALSTATKLDIELNNTTITKDLSGTTDDAIASEIANIINTYSTKTGVVAVATGNQVTLYNDNNTGTEANLKNIKLNAVFGSDNSGLTDATVITAYQYTYSTSSVTPNAQYDDSIARSFKTTEDLRAAMQTDARNFVNYTGSKVDIDGADDDPATTDANGTQITWSDVEANNYNPGAIVTVNAEGKFQIENVSNINAFDAALLTQNSVYDTTAAPAGSGTWTMYSDTLFPIGTVFDNIDITNNGATNITIQLDTPATITIAPGATAAVNGTLASGFTLPKNSTLADNGVGTGKITAGTNGISYNQNSGTATDQSMYLSVTGLTDNGNDVGENLKFTTSFSAIQGSLVKGTSIRTTQNIYSATHASSIDVYDSLGSKHTVRFEFRKTGTTDNGGTEWSMMISVPEPGEINSTGVGLDNVVTGSIKFNSDGSLATFNPTSITYTANNGSTPNQNILLQFGTLGQFDGMTSFDKESNTSGISQDGYPGGDLSGIRVDETGTLIGSFTNGRSFGLAQVSMAKFTNNEGLESDGGNTFIQTSNSGDPVIGQASVGGRGAVQASSLEMSNVDLSRSLTQLIVIQRGYQANSKTITTSDEMLNTLLQLK
ncbi:flagellar hook protein FlgE [Sulfurospirillum cavolei]|uniref:flagellar hook protein FlgE n=1 Tax=Sulfurospirillum cavolei TaxID=366522 RepID=UPI0005A98D24|nr:flagellar hook protein FlgE [Sulfurospirillum cavolei]